MYVKNCYCVVTSHSGGVQSGGAKSSDKRVSVCQRAYLKNMSTFQKLFCTCYLWPWLLGPPQTTAQYVMYFLFCGRQSCLRIMEPVGHNQRQSHVSFSLLGSGTGGKVAVYDCRLVAD